jgi:hypothetical protein
MKAAAMLCAALEALACSGGAWLFAEACRQRPDDAE